MSETNDSCTGVIPGTIAWGCGEDGQYCSEACQQAAETPHKKLMRRLAEMSDEEVFQTSVRAGIHNPDGTLTEPYRDDEEDSS